MPEDILAFRAIKGYKFNLSCAGNYRTQIFKNTVYLCCNRIAFSIKLGNHIKQCFAILYLYSFSVL